MTDIELASKPVIEVYNNSGRQVSVLVDCDVISIDIGDLDGDD